MRNFIFCDLYTLCHTKQLFVQSNVSFVEKGSLKSQWTNCKINGNLKIFLISILKYFDNYSDTRARENKHCSIKSHLDNFLRFTPFVFPYPRQSLHQLLIFLKFFLRFFQTIRSCIAPGLKREREKKKNNNERQKDPETFTIEYTTITPSQNTLWVLWQKNVFYALNTHSRTVFPLNKSCNSYFVAKTTKKLLWIIHLSFNHKKLGR